MKKKKKFYVDNFKENILKHKNDLPVLLKKEEKINTNTWFDMSKQDSLEHKKNCNIKYKNTTKEVIKCKKIIMVLDINQKNILQKWFDAYTDMYNEGVKYIKTNYIITKHSINRDQILNQINIAKNNEQKHFDNFYFLRSELKNIRDQLKIDAQINTHTLDYALHQLCSNIKSGQTNLIRNNFKRFRIKYWRKNRPSQTIEIEKVYIRNNMICPKKLGLIKYIYNKKEYILDNITTNVKINYNKITDEYSLLIPIKFNTITNNNNKLISLDPGIRTFMSGISENGAINIGTNVNNQIGKQIRRINKIKNNVNIPNKIKKKNELLINRKISNKVDELHWKTINYLIKNYKTILLGNMSSKSIVCKKNSVLGKVQKVACLRTSFYKFQQRLEYKCLSNKINFNYIDESYTSKTCSKCGYYKKDLGSNSIFICSECDLIINRDINGARNIYTKYFCTNTND